MQSILWIKLAQRSIVKLCHSSRDDFGSRNAFEGFQ